MSDENDDTPSGHRLSRRNFVTALGLAAAAGSVDTASAATSVGNGSYLTTKPTGESGPQSTQYTTSQVSAPLPTNEWWSTLLWFQYSKPMTAHPVVAEATSGGLDVSNPTAWTFSTDGNADPHDGNVAMMDDSTDLTIGHTESSLFGDARCTGYGDWSVDVRFGDGTPMTLETTVAQGSPYVFCEYEGGGAALSFPTAPTIFADEGNVLGVEINGHAYGLYAPSESTWSGKGTAELTSDLDGEGYLTVAALPDATGTALSTLETYAYNFLTDTRVDWTYDDASGDVTTTYSFTTRAKAESGATGTYAALFPHQHKYASASFTGDTYASARGTMETLAGVTSFETVHTFRGVLPFLPDEGTYDESQLASYVDDVEAESTLVRKGADDPGDGTYWTGKNYGRLAELIPIAEQVGDTAARERFLDGDSDTLGLRADLEIWLDASRSGPSDSEDDFYYDENWGTLIGYNDSFGSGANINDHHFHYGYYIQGAAEIARNDPTWARDANWGGMVDLLIRDIASPDRTDSMFPFLRHFSPYEGHSWADGGGADFANGNNQESSSEAINAYANMILWGEYTGDTTVRDAGVFLYTQEVAAIREYWFDVDDQNHPDDWNYDYAAMVWGNGYKYDTWWTDDAEAIHGINTMPMTASLEYLGWDTAHAASNYREMERNNGGARLDYWPDVMWEFRAFSDVEDAKTMWANSKDSYSVEFGESRAHTYHWIYTIDGMGTPDPSITADHPLTAVSDDGTSKTYAAYNADSSATTVTFSDGTTLEVPANSMATSSGGGSSSAPAIDAFSVTNDSNGGWARFDVDWAVSDGDADLSSVAIELRQDGVVDSATVSVSGGSASGGERVQEKKGSGTYDVVLTVTDAAGHSTSQTKTVTA